MTQLEFSFVKDIPNSDEYDSSEECNKDEEYYLDYL